MKYMFPYQKVKKNSRIVLYGDGDIGKEFFIQIHYSDYCKIVAWVDRMFDYYELQAPYDRVENIMNYEFDYIVLAIRNENEANKVLGNLTKDGIDEKKIIWTRFYEVGYDIMPQNRKRYLQNMDYYMELIDSYLMTDTFLGGHMFYQDYPEIGIVGARKNAERIIRYHLPELLTKDSRVINIGCNCGFFDLQISPYIKEVYGIDIDPQFIDIAKKTKEYMEIENVRFEVKNFLDGITGKFDAVCLLGVHQYIIENGGISYEEFVERVMELIDSNGILFFESHGMFSDAERYRSLCNLFKEQGMKEILMENLLLTEGNRDLTVFRR